MEYFYGEECGRVPFGETVIETRRFVRRILGEEVEIDARVRVHVPTGEVLPDEELDGAAQHLAFAAYQERHDIPVASEIARLREQYGLSQRGLSTLLGFGPITVHRYESGDLPDASHAQALRRLRNAVDVSCLLTERGHLLPPSARRKVEDRLHTLLQADRPDQYLKIARLTARYAGPDLHTGYQRFQPETLIEMALFFAAKAGGVFKTKLNKLLWYADFLHFQRYAVGISGAAYLRLPYGPVPDQYALFFATLEEEGDIEVREEYFASGSGERLIATRPADHAVFDADQIATLDWVADHFASSSSQQISETSHQERAWLDTATGAVIPYSFASALSVRLAEG